MFGIKSKKKTAQNAKTPSPQPRELGVWAGDVRQQAQSNFFLRLPAEVRNEIYEHVFTPDYTCVVLNDRWEREDMKMERTKAKRGVIDKEYGDIGVRGEAVDAKRGDDGNTTIPQPISTPRTKPTPKSKPKKPAQPLSLLLTCRLINNEATLLAFNLYPFPNKSCPTYFTLRQHALALPAPCFAALRALSFTVDPDIHAFVACNDLVSDFLTNALLLSPRIAELEVRVKTFPGAQGAFMRGDGRGEAAGGRATTCREHLAVWFLEALGRTQNGRSCVWQRGEEWELSWPNLHAHADDAVWDDSSRRARMCRGPCVSVFEQPGSGRKVTVRLVYDFKGEAVHVQQRERLNVTLVPGAKALELQRVNGESGFVYDPGQEYWDDKRKRMGKKPLLGSNEGAGEAARIDWKGGLAKVFWGGGGGQAKT
ncbi:hypothetical protein IQ07DRAFT_594546 [Pyrenochaeta sp. DS3sAY3a]|nr:hypothetical protein IQ07DRAFT_594546 [Pyrenochaeta sp. DS3sAY3a]